MWIPFQLPILVFGASALLTSISFWFTLIMSDSISVFYRTAEADGLYGMSILLGFWLFGFLSRRWARATLRMEREMGEFDVRHAQCTDEADRAIVTRMIAGLYESSEDRDATSCEESLDAFNMKMRENVRAAFLGALGRNRIRYELALAMAWTDLLWVPDEFAAMYLNDFSWQAIVVEMVISILKIFCLYPLAVALLVLLSRSCLGPDSARVKDAVYNLGCALLCGLLFFFVFTGLKALDPCAQPAEHKLAPFAIVTASIALMTCIVFWPAKVIACGPNASSAGAREDP